QSHYVAFLDGDRYKGSTLSVIIEACERRT
ncbi:unnamed protein product, partial [marine sediment metagenome]